MEETMKKLFMEARRTISNNVEMDTEELVWKIDEGYRISTGLYWHMKHQNKNLFSCTQYYLKKYFHPLIYL